MSVRNQMFPPCPKFTEKDLIDLSSKVYIVTGATSGVGQSLAKILYGLNATIYVGGRTTTRCSQVITAIQKELPSSKGSLKPFIADLSDLNTIKNAVSTFLSSEYRLDVLFLNAGVMLPPAGSKTKDGYDLELGTNCLAAFLLVKLLSPIMRDVSGHFCYPNPSIRVVWVSSCLDLGTPNGGVQLDEEGVPKQLKGMENYMQSKAAVYLLAHEFSKREKKNERGNGVIHVSLNPGFMKTELQRDMPLPARLVMGVVFKGPKYGAYTELYAGLAPGVVDGGFYFPWGRKGDVPAHVAASTKTGDRSKSVSNRLYDWCEEQVRSFL
ncbi:NAD(P)-binding protein [Lojkania enalia]|uniref:NAD(P)-binding protein n=1 Tax=Lojkania enalia TaxID=147567 RepID=A0A9P4K974_9PLEO|nr:NAD(P)-binding protein [Didymosphaeria enalia]